VNKEIKLALQDYFMMQVDYNNNGILARHKMSLKSASVMANNRVDINGDIVLIEDVPMYKIEPNYSYRLDKELMPTLIAIDDDMPDIKLSAVRDR